MLGRALRLSYRRANHASLVGAGPAVEIADLPHPATPNADQQLGPNEGGRGERAEPSSWKGISNDLLESALLARRALRWGQYRVPTLETYDGFMSVQSCTLVLPVCPLSRVLH